MTSSFIVSILLRHALIAESEYWQNQFDAATVKASSNIRLTIDRCYTFLRSGRRLTVFGFTKHARLLLSQVIEKKER